MKKIIDWLDVNFEPVIISVLFYIMTLIVTVQVILRLFFKSGFSWGEEVSRFIFVWLMYFCISYATRNQRHIRMSFFIEKFNEKIQKSIMIFVDFLFLIFSSFAFTAAIKICESVVKFGDRAVTVNVSLNIVYAAGVVGYALIMIRVIQGVIWKFRNFSSPMDMFVNYAGVYTKSDKICITSVKDSKNY